MHVDRDEARSSEELAKRRDASLHHWTSEELLDGETEAIITHAGEIYRLRCTRNNKLILHK
ncbi:MAG: hemin uptake protein HemP [Planctomycetaceae bacterium]|nr:hemin uptake protein HemP [Planctomycetales bacterium]MCB9926712.1 hemin uptake protein HemP [Planctomycetaceae bacterium]